MFTLQRTIRFCYESFIERLFGLVLCLLEDKVSNFQCYALGGPDNWQFMASTFRVYYKNPFRNIQGVKVFWYQIYSGNEKLLLKVKSISFHSEEYE